MIHVASAVLSLAFLALAMTGAGLGVAALHGLLQRRGRPADPYAHRVRAAGCATLRRYGTWWLACATAWLAAALALRAAVA
jgi:hypothetical protein